MESPTTASYLGDPVHPDELRRVVRDLGVLALDFGQVNRATYHPDGVTPESDTTHTVMLGLLACALAERIDRDLNVGAVAQLALVHDLPEAYAGDTPTLRLPTAWQQADKEQREEYARGQLAREFGNVLPWIPLTVNFYEGRTCPEADFVWGVDKICPKITHIANGGATLKKIGMGVADLPELVERYRVQRDQMQDRCGRWPALLRLYDLLVEEELDTLRAELSGT